MRVVFLGNDRWSVPALEALAGADDIRIELVVTNIPRAAGRGSRVTSTEVARAARALQLPTFETPRVSSIEARQLLSGASPDVLAVVAYGELLSAEVLATAAFGAVNLHFSLLPRWRGASPVQRAILAGDTATGVTAMLMDEGLDTGPILLTEEVAIAPGEDAGSLGRRMAELGAPLLVSAVRSVARASATPRQQDDSLATAAPKLSKADRIIDWGQDGAQVVRRVRALAPEPGAQTVFAGRILKVFGADLQETDRSAAMEPGTVTQVSSDSILIATGGASVSLTQVAEAGRKRMSAGAWARGSRLVAGERLG